jgi:transmembrane sensor
MNAGARTSPQLLEEAGEWFMRVRAAPADSKVHAEWLAWIEADPAHRDAFADVQEAWDIVGEIESPPWPRPQELQERDRYGARRLAGYALAAGVCAGAAVLALVRFDLFADGMGSGSADHQRITTARAEPQSASLPDGSKVRLGALTGVELAFTRERRLVIADEGEIFYQVERDPQRPFIVQAGPVNVTAIGTAFSVRREGEVVSVVVGDGVVEVNAQATAGANAALAPAHTVRAKAGERVRFDGQRLTSATRPVDATQLAAWQRGQLRFEEEPLRVVVASLNRYTMRQIVIADAQLADLHFTGTVFEDGIEDWLSGIQVVFPIVLDERNPSRILIRRRE